MQGDFARWFCKVVLQGEFCRLFFCFRIIFLNKHINSINLDIKNATIYNKNLSYKFKYKESKMSISHQTLTASKLQVVVKNTLKVLFASGFIAISAQIVVPMYPVPMTMQTFAVLLTAAVLGSRLGTLAVVVYLSEGLAGMPVFAGGNFGIHTLMGPTGGYLIGFVFASYVVGKMLENTTLEKLSIVKITGSVLLGTAIIFAFGLLQLAGLIGLDKPFVSLGLAPFVFGAIAKTVLVATSFVIFKKISS